MSPAAKATRLFRPWAGLVAGTAAAVAAELIGSGGSFDHCAAMSPVPLLVVATLCLALAVLGAAASVGVLREREPAASRRLVAFFSVGMAGLACVAVILPMMASLVLPPCFG